MDRKSKVSVMDKRYVRYTEGCEIYSIGQSTFEKYAKASGACIKLGKLVLVDCAKFEEFLEGFRLEPEPFE